MTNENIKSLDILKGNDTYLVIGTSGKYTTEVLNLNTMEEETIEGDYTDNGSLDHLDLTNKGNFELYLDTLPEKAAKYKAMVTDKAKDIHEFYLA